MTEMLPPVDLYVVPCGAGKTDQPARARDLYTGAHFRYTLARVEAEARATEQEYGQESRTMILSARHGLLDPDTVVAPYDTTMGDPDSIPVDQLAGQLRTMAVDRKVSVYAFLPRAYHQRIRAAADLLNADDTIPEWTLVYDVYEAAPGIGHHRHAVGCIG